MEGLKFISVEQYLVLRSLNKELFYLLTKNTILRHEWSHSSNKYRSYPKLCTNQDTSLWPLKNVEVKWCVACNIFGNPCFSASGPGCSKAN